MKLYAQIINEQTKLVAIGEGTETDFYKSIGMEEMEVEQAFDGAWYVKGYAPAKPAPTVEEIQKMLTDGVQAYMDTKAQERGYDNIHTACSYANSTDEIFKAEGTACLAWRDSVWRKCYNILDEVKAGKRGIPTLEEVIAELPVLVW
jgi:hypothetical protein